MTETIQRRINNETNWAILRTKTGTGVSPLRREHRREEAGQVPRPQHPSAA